MRALTTSLIGVAYFAAAAAAFSQDAAEEPTAVKIYRVGDLAAQQTVRKTLTLETVTPKEFNGEHAETITALQKLADLIETIVPPESGAVAVHEESVSLVVRHSAAGHQQVEQLLEQLREKERPSVELTFNPITGDEAEELIQEIGFQTSYDPETTGKILKLLESREEGQSHLLLKPITVELTNGRKTQCGHLFFQLYVTALATEDSDEIRLRIDSTTNLEVTKQERLKIQSQSFAILPGHSVLLFGGFDLTDDGHEEFLLAVPKRIEPEQKVTSASRDATE